MRLAQNWRLRVREVSPWPCCAQRVLFCAARLRWGSLVLAVSGAQRLALAAFAAQPARDASC